MQLPIEYRGSVENLDKLIIPRNVDISSAREPILGQSVLAVFADTGLYYVQRVHRARAPAMWHISMRPAQTRCRCIERCYQPSTTYLGCILH